MRSCHDPGGAPAGPGDRTEKDFALWEKRVEAMLAILPARTSSRPIKRE